MLLDEHLNFRKVLHDRFDFDLVQAEEQCVRLFQQFQKFLRPVFDLRAAFLRLETAAADRAADQPGVAHDAGLVLDLFQFCLAVSPQILRKELPPERSRGLEIKALEAFDHFMIHLRKTDERVIDAAQLEDRMADRQRIHIDQQHFVVLELQIFRVIVAVDHMIVVRDRLH